MNLRLTGGGYSPAGDIKGKFYTTSDGNSFSIAIHRINNNSVVNGSTMLKNMISNVLPMGGNETYLNVFYYNGTSVMSIVI